MLYITFSFYIVNDSARCYNKVALNLKFSEELIAMELKKWTVLLALGATLAAGTAFAVGSPDSPFKPDEQVYPKEELFTFDKQDVAKGKGTAYGKFAFARDKAAPDSAIKEICYLTLEKGASIGCHKHGFNEDAYIIISGEGIFTDGTGKETPVKAGDVTIARPGQSHGLRNEKETPLVFLDVIAQNDTYLKNHPEAAPKK